MAGHRSSGRDVGRDRRRATKFRKAVRACFETVPESLSHTGSALRHPRPNPSRGAYRRICSLGFTGERVFVTENEINGLAFPNVPASLVIFGLGYGLERLGEVGWLRQRALHYWGDIDTYGFHILDRLRSIFPDAQSFLMDRETLPEHVALWVRENNPYDGELRRLTAAESALYEDLRHNRLGDRVRLEQERIPFGRIERALDRGCCVLAGISAPFPRPARLPAGSKGLLGGGRRGKWQCELAHLDHELFQIVRLFGEPAPANECAPLDRPRWVFIEGVGEPNGFGLDARSPMPEGRDDGLDQMLAVKRVHPGQEGEVVVIFHAAVEQAEFGERFELLGDDGLPGIGVEHGSAGNRAASDTRLRSVLAQ